MLGSGEKYFWNSGVFLGRVSVFLDSLSHFIPGVYGQIDFKSPRKNAFVCNYSKVRRTRMFDDSVLKNIVDSDRETESRNIRC